MRPLSPQIFPNERRIQDSQKMVANAHSETSFATVDLQLEVGDVIFRERFIVNANLVSPQIGLFFLQPNSAITDML